MIRVDQQPLGKTPTSNPATYTGVFELIRAALRPAARGRSCAATRRGGSASTWPAGGARSARATASCGSRCTSCPTSGSSATRATAGATTPRRWPSRYHGQSIADVLEMSCGEAVELFENIPKIRRILQTLCDVGLDYLTLGQPAPTLSGGEAQRVKLAAELSRPDTGQTLYLLDEPTTGLHFDDLAKLLDVLNRLVDLGNTVVVIEHNLDVIKTADWVIDLGPEAGDEGGHVVVAGTPEDVVAHARRWQADGQVASADGAACCARYTGEVLDPVLAAGPHRRSGSCTTSPPTRPSSDGDLDITEVGREAKMPWEVDGRRWHTQRPRRPQRQPLPLGRPRSWPTWSTASSELGPVQRHRLEQPQRGRDPRAEEVATAGSSTPSPARRGC